MKNITYTPNIKPHWLLMALLLSALMFSSTLVKSQTTLSTGDVAFTAYNCGSNAADTFAIMLLTNIQSGTEIIFTDGYYTDASGYFLFPGAATSDWAFRWTASSDMSAGTQIKFWTSTVSCSGNCGANASAGTITWGRGLSLPSSGDQIFACQGGTIDTTTATRKYTPGTVLAGIHTNYISGTTNGTNWDDGAANSTSNSELPSALTTGTNAVLFNYIGVGLNNEVDNLRYDCSSVFKTGLTTANIRAAINDSANWSYYDAIAGSFTPTLCSDVVVTWNGTNWIEPQFSVSQPPNQGTIAAIGSNTTPGAFTSADLYINSGFDLTLNSGVTATIYGSLINNGNGTSGTGTLRFARQGSPSLLGTAFSHAGVVEVATGDTLTTGGLLTLENGASLMHGTSTPNGGGIVSGNVTLQKTIGSTTKGWRMFSLPVDMLIDNFETGINTLCSNHATAGERNVYYYDATAGAPAPISGNYAVGWTQANNTTDDENKAYSIYLDNTSHGAWDFSSTVSATGTPNDGTKTFNLQYTFDPASTGTLSVQRGWNQIPNYFPSNITVVNLINDANFGTTYKAIHVWNQGLGQMVGMNQSTMNTYNNSGTSVYSTTRQIPPFMGFWVKATSTSQSIQLKNSMRTSLTDSLPANTYFKTDFDVFRLDIKDKEGKADRFSVWFDDAATEGMDYSMDIYKFKSFSEEVPTLYTMVDGDMISLNALPIKTEYTMPLHMESFTDGKEYTFSPVTDEYKNYFDVLLEDKKTGKITSILDNNYTFNHDINYKGNRFVLSFKKKSTTSVDELFSQEKMYAYTNDNGINVVYNNNNTQAGAIVEIYNIMGQKLYSSAKIHGGETVTYMPASATQQVYVVNIVSNGKTKAFKVIR